MDFTNKRFLVIGGAGLIGSHTVDELIKTKAREIVIFDNLSRGTLENVGESLKDPKVQMFKPSGDILHRDVLDAALQNVDGVFHFSALWLLHCQEYPRSAFDVNVGGTMNIIEACVRNGVKRIVFSSSASVYGDAVAEPMTEDHPYLNTNFYGATKIAGEHIYRGMYHLYRNTSREFDYAGLRYMNVYGPRQDYKGAYVSVIMKILDRIDQGLPPVVHGDGTQAYDFVYVGDCAKANVLAMKSESTDRFYNVGTGTKTSILELTKLILHVCKSNLEVQFNPSGVTFVKNRVGCPIRAKTELGFSADTALEDGIGALIEWRRKNKQQVDFRRLEG